LEDRADLVKGADVISFTSDALEGDLEITGQISITLYAASSAAVKSVSAALVDVFPDGYCHQIQEGIVGARYRDSEREPTLIEPGQVYRYSIDLWATSFLIEAGHRLRVDISSSNFNRFDRNLNTGGPLGREREPRIGHETIYHDRQRRSHILLPINPSAPAVRCADAHTRE
jgi:hypothetical protein